VTGVGNLLATCLLLCGQASPSADQHGIGPGQRPIKIEGLLTGPAGFISVRNTSAAPVDLGGWSMRYCSGQAFGELAAIPPGAVVPAGGQYLIAGLDFAGTVQQDLTVAAVVGTGAMFVDSGRSRVDSVGLVPDSPCREGSATIPCGVWPVGRDELARDTDDNLVDFSCRLD